MVSSLGETVAEAKEAIKEAIEAFIEECEGMGILEEVLEEWNRVFPGSVIPGNRERRLPKKIPLLLYKLNVREKNYSHTL